MPDQPGLDLSFRPPSYWGPATERQRLIAGIKGAERRRQVEEAIESGDLAGIPSWMMAEKLPEFLRNQAGSIHPRFMGGEYLPASGPREIEIARVTLQSSTQDVMSIRARPVGDRVRYRISDEYDGKWTISPASSRQPLPMARLISLMDGARVDDAEHWTSGVVLSPLAASVDGSIDRDPMSRIHFVEVTSVFYPNLGLY